MCVINYRKQGGTNMVVKQNLVGLITQKYMII